MKIGIVGCGAYGISLAVNLAKCNDVMMWTALEDEKKYILKNRENNTLPGIKIDKKIIVTTDEKEIMNNDVIILVVPVNFFESTLYSLKDYVNNQTFIIASKGLVNGNFLNELTSNILKTDKVGIISGGTFAIDMANYVDCGLTVAGNKEVQNIITKCFNIDNIKLDYSNNLRSIELCGALKNICAIIMGIANVMELTETTKSMLLTNIINDINKVINIFDIDNESILTYAGIGDILLTCTSNKSRNFTFGEMLVNDRNNIDNYLNNNTVEGVKTLNEITEILKKQNIKIELFDKLDNIINNQESIDIILK